jgi:hypothetical protein
VSVTKVRKLLSVVMWTSIAAICLLTFVWPLAVSADPGHPAFKIAAIATFAVFFTSLAALLAVRLKGRR